MLSEIKRYLMKQRRATLNDIAIHFDTEPEAVKEMLEQWIRKGRILKSGIHSDCSKVCGECCNATEMVIYEWVY